MERYRVDFGSMSWETPAVGIRFKAYQQGGRKLRLVEFTREFVEPHWCTNGHIGYVLEGQMEIDFNGKKVVFGAGDGMFILMDKKHKAKVITDLAKVILVEDA